MHILYGVQATGQGHISRARAMAAALKHFDIEVTWLFSGRARHELFDMEPFGDLMHRSGLTFVTNSGRVKRMATLRNSTPLTFVRDARGLDLSAYDLVVTDYEPVTAWAAKIAGIRSIGIGHQYAFGQDTPIAGSNLVTRSILRHFAPVELPLGLHWHCYNDNVLPPILDLPQLPLSNQGHVLVYLPFEDQNKVTRILQQLPWQRFVQYANGLQHATQKNVQHCPASAAKFKQHLASCAGVICNSGFELISECLQWRKPILTRPLAGQTEQLSNALALKQLNLAQTTNTLSAYEISHWLTTAKAASIAPFPDVAGCLAKWLAQGANAPPARLAAQLWQQSNAGCSADADTSWREAA